MLAKNRPRTDARISSVARAVDPPVLDLELVRLCLLAAPQRALPPGDQATPHKGSRAVVRGILGNAMSQQDVENVRQAYEAWESQGVEGLIAFLDAEVEWRAP